eukprot:gnl/Dysnectes_brevis/516_a572_2681.p1 GENE.gnl/Dysnectes_brevis/516_a572_2681~~gnl/Dysnectes_brevis/516_a572_2681.p1  ORF type:complete len:568 (-),score=298.36 gnl/Dysnectes_brevis/516_a572_2681:86-1789(-)
MSMNIVIIGGVAAGPKVASRIERLAPKTHKITMIDRGSILSYGGCGLPFWLAGEVDHEAELYSTASGTVRNEGFFSKVKGFEAKTETEVVEIDRAGKRVKTRHLPTGAEEWLPYDKLVLSTGSVPFLPPLPGAKGRSNLFTVKRVEDIRRLKDTIPEGEKIRACIVGGGLIGVEMADALEKQGHAVTMVEMLPHILPMFDGHVSALIENHMRSKGVDVQTDTRVEEMEGDGDLISAVRTSRGTFPTDLVVLAIGARPATGMAKAIGLELGVRGSIVVNDQQQTSDEDIYAAGDCCQSKNRLTGEPCWVPLGSTANKQGRVAANAIMGHPDSFPGVLGTTICKVFDMSIGIAGLNETAAKAAGMDIVTIMCAGPDRAHFHPDMKPVAIKLTVEKGTRRLLGLQAVGRGEVAKRVDVAAIAISSGWTVDQLAQADLAYAPPHGSAMDNIIVAANVARNLLDGFFTIVMPDVGHEMLSRPGLQLVDVRSHKEYVGKLGRLANSVLIPLGTFRKRFVELSKEQDVLLYCKSSLRAFEAARQLLAEGFKKEKVIVMAGGMLCYPYAKQFGPE